MNYIKEPPEDLNDIPPLTQGRLKHAFTLCIHYGGKFEPLHQDSYYECDANMIKLMDHFCHLLVHCDVKPQNMLILGEDDAKLADFGSCKISKDDEKCDFRGTILYVAPESISRQSYVPESDVWALGCSVLHMLTGKSPWEFDKKAEVKDVLFKIGCGDEIPEIPTNNKILKEAKDFLNKCLIKDPTVRWKADMLLDHPFVKVEDIYRRVDGNCSSHHHQHHVSSRLSHRIHSLVPHCFHVPKVRAC
ncbi:hypothetical protein OROHE_021397 [Orobanche hederae]